METGVHVFSTGNQTHGVNTVKQNSLIAVYVIVNRTVSTDLGICHHHREHLSTKYTTG